MALNLRAIATLGIGYGPLAMASLGFLPLYSAEIPYEPAPPAGSGYVLEQARAAVNVRVAAVEASDQAHMRLEVTWDDDDEEVLQLWAATVHGAG
jgi:hypothetical protein